VRRSLTREVARRAPREHYPAPYAIIDLWARYGAHGPEAVRAEPLDRAPVHHGNLAQLVRVFLLQDRLKSAGGKSAADIRHVHVWAPGSWAGNIAAWSALRGFTVTLQDSRPRVRATGAAAGAGAVRQTLARAAQNAAARARLRADVGLGEACPECRHRHRGIFESLERSSSYMHSSSHA